MDFESRRDVDETRREEMEMMIVMIPEIYNISRRLHIPFIIIQPPTSNHHPSFSPLSEENQTSFKRIGEKKREEGEKKDKYFSGRDQTGNHIMTRPSHQLRVEFAERSRRWGYPPSLPKARLQPGMKSSECMTA